MAIPSTQRRWTRHPVNLPARILAHNGLNTVVPARATEISEGGLALYAGMPMEAGDIAEIEFHTPQRSKILGVVRHRTGYCFGVEFLSPLSSDNDITASMQWAAVNLVRVTADVADKVKLAENGAAAFSLLQRVLSSGGKPEDAQQAGNKAKILRGQIQEVYALLQETKGEIRRVLGMIEQMPVLTADAVDTQASTLRESSHAPNTRAFAAAASGSTIDISRVSRD
jgi:PilZ domain